MTGASTRVSCQSFAVAIVLSGIVSPCYTQTTRTAGEFSVAVARAHAGHLFHHAPASTRRSDARLLRFHLTDHGIRMRRDSTVSPDIRPTAGASPRSRLWVTAALFFTQYVAFGLYFTFLNVYLKAQGLTGAEIGFNGMVVGILTMLGTFGWSYLADRTGRPRVMLALGALGALVGAQFIPLVAANGLQPAFWWYVVINAFVGLMNASITTLIDSTAVAMLGDQRHRYGVYRLGGSFGFIIGGVGAGLLYDRVGYEWMFAAFAAVMLIFVGFTFLLPARVTRAVGSGKQQIGQMIRRPEWLILIASLFVFWAGYSASFAFNGVILKTMGASDSLISYATVIGTVIELPFMAFSGRLIKRFGPSRLLAVGLLIQAVRFALLSQMRIPEWAIAINMLNGPGYVFTWNSAIYLVARLAPPGLGATSQGFMTSSLNLANILSSAASGVIYDRFGFSTLYLLFAVASTMALAMFGAGRLLSRSPQAAVTE